MPGERRFILRRAAEFVESEGDRPDLTLAGVSHQSEKGTGIDTRREKNPDLDVRQKMAADTIEHCSAQALAEFGSRSRVRCASCEDCGEVGERPGLARPRSIDGLRVPGRQGANVAVERKRLGHASEQMKAGNSRRLGIARNAAAREQSLDLRGEAERPAVVCGVERLDAVRVASMKELVPVLIPDRETEHTAQPVHHRCAVARVEVQKRLRIGGRPEARAGSLEF